MDIKITINTDSAAFEDCQTEVKRILQDIINKVDSLSMKNPFCLNIRDYNGNKAGEFSGK